MCSFREELREGFKTLSKNNKVPMDKILQLSIEALNKSKYKG